MHTNKFRIPRIAMAVLVLGGTACDDEENEKPAEAEKQESNTPNNMKDDADTREPETTRDSGPQTSSIDVSDARVAKIAADFCMTAFTCDQAGASEEFVDQKTCVSDQVGYFQEYITTYGDACGDAQLDFYDCLARVDCDTDPDTACEEEFGTFVVACL